MKELEFYKDEWQRGLLNSKYQRIGYWEWKWGEPEIITINKEYDIR
jgi:hypothetical protein